MRIHHVQLMMPLGREADALRFYGELLGLSRIARPENMPSPGGVWFALGGEHQLHLGAQDADVDPTSRAHVALLADDFDAVVARLHAAGVATQAADAVDGLRRAHLRDPFGNRLELMGV